MMLVNTPDHQGQPVSNMSFMVWAVGAGAVCVCVYVWGGEGCQLTSKIILPLYLISTDFSCGHWWHSGRVKHPVPRDSGKKALYACFQNHWFSYWLRPCP